MEAPEARRGSSSSSSSSNRPRRGQCPKCRRHSLEEIWIDGDDQHPVYVCSVCNDPLTIDGLIALADGAENVNVTVTVMTCDKCGNKDTDRQRVVELVADRDAPDSVAEMRVGCLACRHVQSLFMINVDVDDDGDDDDGDGRLSDSDIHSSCNSATSNLPVSKSRFYVTEDAEQDRRSPCLPSNDTALNSLSLATRFCDTDDAKRVKCGKQLLTNNLRRYGPASKPPPSSRETPEDRDDRDAFSECFSCRCCGRTVAHPSITSTYTEDGELVHIHCDNCNVDLPLPRAASHLPSSSTYSGYKQPSREPDRVRSCDRCGNGDRRWMSETYDVDGTLVYCRCRQCGSDVVDVITQDDTVNLFRQMKLGREHTTSQLQQQARSSIPEPHPPPRPQSSLARPRRTRVRHVDQIRRGDHVASHRSYGVWHHMIVETLPVKLVPTKCRLHVIHNSGEPGEVFKKLISPLRKKLKPAAATLGGRYPDVRRDVIEIDLGNEELYRFDYPPPPNDDPVNQRSPFSADEIVRRARSRLDSRYNPLTWNCEHFARWCVTGLEISEQVGTFVERLGAAGGYAGARLVCDGLGLVVAGGRAARQAASALGSAAKVVRNVRVGAQVFNVAANVVIEGAMFGVEAAKAYRKYRSREIDADDFRQQIGKAGAGAVGGFVGGTVGSLLGDILIPVPLVGSIVGCTLGSLFGRWCGAMIGKLMTKKKI